MSRRAAMAVMTAVVIAMTAGCAPRRDASVPGQGPSDVVLAQTGSDTTMTAQPDETDGTVPGGPAGGAGSSPGVAGPAGIASDGGGKVDMSAVDAQLRTLQGELDSLAMPSASDFDSAEQALY